MDNRHDYLIRNEPRKPIVRADLISTGVEVVTIFEHDEATSMINGGMLDGETFTGKDMDVLHDGTVALALSVA